MAQLQNLVLTDRSTPTPVNHTFVPARIDANGAGYVKETTGVPIGEPNYSVRVFKTSGGSYRINLRLVVPIVQTETVNGVSSPKIVRSGYCDLTVTVSSLSTEQERKDLIGLFASSLESSKTLVNDALINLNPPY